MSNVADFRRKPHAVRYPWDQWLSRPARGAMNSVVLRRGTHYYCQPHGMRSTIIQASRRSPYVDLVKVKILMDEGTITLEVRRAK
jgi:hypothetical protein